MKRKLAKAAPKRDSISTESKYDKVARQRKEEMVRASKKRKLKQQQKEGAVGTANVSAGDNSPGRQPGAAKKAKVESTCSFTAEDNGLVIKKHLKKKKKNKDKKVSEVDVGSVILKTGKKKKKNPNDKENSDIVKRQDSVAKVKSKKK
jgi:hypothetical protein